MSLVRTPAMLARIVAEAFAVSPVADDAFQPGDRDEIPREEAAFVSRSRRTQQAHPNTKIDLIADLELEVGHAGRLDALALRDQIRVLRSFVTSTD